MQENSAGTEVVDFGRRSSDSLVVTVLAHVTDMFKNHTTDEMLRYSEIQADIKESRKQSEERHLSLTAKLEEFIRHQMLCHVAPCEHLKKAVPEENFDGHRDYHQDVIAATRERKELYAYIKRVVLTGAIMSVGGWLLVLVWKGFLIGPKG